MTAVFRRQMSRLLGLKFAPAALDTHWEALSDLSEADLTRAVTQAQRECDEFPSPRQLRSFARTCDWAWNCPHVDRCGNREMCQNATLLHRPERATTEAS